MSTLPFPRRRPSSSVFRFWPIFVGVCLVVAGLFSVWTALSDSKQVVQLSAEKVAAETQRDFVANRASTFAADALSACSDEEIKEKLPVNMCPAATRIASDPIPKQIVGPQGERGLQGVQGIQGPAGPAGLAGVDGKDGLPGPRGVGIVSVAFEASGSRCFAVIQLSDGRVDRPEVASQICGTSTISSSEDPSAGPTPG
jgi:hypothetical protein